MSNIDNTLKERGSRYGEFVDHADITQNLKAAMALGRNWDSLDNDMREALEMMAHKVGRILNGDPNYIDSWTDIIGYARLVEKRLIDADVDQPLNPKEMLAKAEALVEAFTGIPARAADKPTKPELKCDCLACQIESLFDKARKAA